MFSNLKYEEKNVKITNHPPPFSASIKANLIFLMNSHIGYYIIIIVIFIPDQRCGILRPFSFNHNLQFLKVYCFEFATLFDHVFMKIFFLQFKREMQLRNKPQYFQLLYVL